MSFSVQRSVVESFRFNGKNITAVNVKGEECLVLRDVYMAIGYGEKNGKKAMQRLVPEKYKMRLGEVIIDMKEADICLHRDTVLLTGHSVKLLRQNILP